MKASNNCIELIKEFEGFSATPYPDVAGFMTVGYGHMIRIGEICDSVTEEKAIELLHEDLAYAEGIINIHVTVPLNQNQFDALVSFVYNVGPGREGGKDGFVTLHVGRQSHMLLCLNAGDYDAAANEFEKWDHAGGVEVQGLLNRRLKEKELFMEPVDA